MSDDRLAAEERLDDAVAACVVAGLTSAQINELVLGKLVELEAP